MEFDDLSEFERDLKQLLKKYRTLREDLETLKKVLAADEIPQPRPPMSFKVAGLGFEAPEIIKVKQFACRALKGRGRNSGFRIIYALHRERRLIQFVEIYFKADQENEDRDRIIRHFGSSN